MFAADAVLTLVLDGLPVGAAPPATLAELLARLREPGAADWRVVAARRLLALGLTDEPLVDPGCTDPALSFARAVRAVEDCRAVVLVGVVARHLAHGPTAARPGSGCCWKTTRRRACSSTPWHGRRRTLTSSRRCCGGCHRRMPALSPPSAPSRSCYSSPKKPRTSPPWNGTSPPGPAGATRPPGPSVPRAAVWRSCNNN